VVDASINLLRVAMVFLDPSGCEQPRGGGRWLITSVKRWGSLNRFQVHARYNKGSGVQGWIQCQQLIVWRFLQPRSQLIKVLTVRHTDEQAFRALAQQSIQCYTQNQIPGAAQAPGCESDKSYGRGIGDAATA
jgi:hypothetical protein